ncbi:MAG: rhomboid family intramembrane serine protease [Bacteroidales bacterium]|nr:rhomboid family intramembrane serine protease [Bacteroidales bacterium]
MNDGQISMGGFNILPKGVKNLLVINILVFAATFVFGKTGICDLYKWLGLHYFSAPDFHPWQFFTYMFMHGNFMHIFFNMFALWMFGAAVENYWGTRRFIIYYLVAGIGAAITHYLITFVQIHPMMVLLDTFLNDPSIETYKALVDGNKSMMFKPMLDANLQYLMQNPDELSDVVAVTLDAKSKFLNSFNLVGASGAVYGLLLAFGMLFPNSTIYIYFLFPIKAKWFVLVFGLIELAYGVMGTSDGVAHFAHLGGMVFGLALILLWRRNSRKNNFYYYN